MHTEQQYQMRDDGGDIIDVDTKALYKTAKKQNIAFHHWHRWVDKKIRQHIAAENLASSNEEYP
jgi:hypothetical protein